jgi:FKBP-type peptidyl-prolyl cis-trans isomerase
MNRRWTSWIPALLLVSAPLLAAPPVNPHAQAPLEPIPPPSDVAAASADAQTTATGLASKVLAAGTGTEHPVATDLVKVHYTGWTTDGKMFDSSVARGRPTVLPLNRVIAGWAEGIPLMVVGEKRRFWIPGKLAYDGQPNKPQGTLVFDVELLDILRVPPVPPDVAAPPADAEKIPNGLAWKVLKAGTGTVHPKPASTVRVHYTGWTTDGKMFDSSYAKGTPATFELTKVIPGWTDGLQRMVEGETRRFWIPSRQAYDGAPGKPRGMLVFDITLLEIVKE